MPRGVYNIKSVFLVLVFFCGECRRPKTSGGGGSNGDASLSFLFHPVHDGLPLVYFTDFMGTAGVIQNTLGSRGLAGVYVGDNAEISYFF